MTSGQLISHYRLLEKLGEGGMGVVYKAEDERLKRIVALKFLPRQAGVGSEEKERFLREAQAAASLDHANICTIYEIDEADGQPFMAMAFVEGRPLDARIAEGPLPLGEAIEIARQAAEGLSAAHAKGVVHRDIKASNLMLAGTPARPQVKILDFGLAQLAGRSRITQTESQVGTIAYMSPEQTQGGAVDGRSDLWSLGVVLYEMIAGELPFRGHYDQATLYSILNEEPEPLTALRSRTPVELDWIIDKCLAKSADERYKSADDLILDLSTLAKKLSSQRLSIHRTQVAAPPIEPQAPKAEPVREKSASSPMLWAAAAAVLFVAGLALAWSSWGGGATAEAPAAADRVLRFDINLPRSLPDDVRLEHLAISPDGRRLAFTTNQQDGRLWVRDLSQAVAWPIEATEGAREIFWSPDSATVGYTAGREIRKVAAQGGPSTTLATAAGSFVIGAAWSPDGDAVVFGSGPPFALYEVAAMGGTPKELLAPDGEAGRGLLTDLRMAANAAGRAYLLGVARGPQGEQIVLRDTATGETTTVASGDAPFYDPAGYLFYQPSRTAEIWAMPFSIEERAAKGDPFPVAQGGREPTVSQDGTLVYMDDALTGGQRRIVWYDRDGVVVGRSGGPQVGIRTPRVSPDGKQVAVAATDSDGRHIWVHADGRETNQRITFGDADDGFPVWSPDGSQLAFSTYSGGMGSVTLRDSDGGGETRRIFTAPGTFHPLGWSPDGQDILLRVRGPRGGGLAYLRRDGDGEFQFAPYLDGVSGLGEASFAPSGEYVVYEAREGEESHIYVDSFPEGGRRTRISDGAGDSPRWSRDGEEIFYVRGNTLVVAPVKLQGGVTAGTPTDLFEHRGLSGAGRSPGYDVSPDGRRFALVEPEGAPPPPTIRVVLDWAAELD